MKATCDDLEKALAGESAEWQALVAEHARGCSGCARELAEWGRLSAGARSMRKEWESPGLWPRISQALAEKSRRRALPGLTALSVLGSRLRSLAGPGGWRARPWVLASVAVVALLVGGIFGRPAARWLGAGGASPPDDWHTAQTLATYPLLTENAVDEVESAERQYEAAIERLSKLVKPSVAQAGSPLVQSYREKLALLDSAIAELRAGIAENSRNAHLRRELLAMYREKQQTLRDLVRMGEP